MGKPLRTLDKVTIRTLAVEAHVDPRTIANVFENPEGLRTMARKRAHAILLKQGLLKAKAGA